MKRTPLKKGKGFVWEYVTPVENPCSACNGSGSHWPKRKDGQPDRRYFFPVGPCPSCDGTGSA